MATGRPSDYTPEIASLICERLALGESLREICDSGGMPNKTTVLRWLQRHDEFRTQYAHARELQAEHWADEIVEIADNGSNDWMERQGRDGSSVEVVNSDHINRSRLRVDTRKWLMARMAPKKYGDRVINEHTGKDGGPIETRNASSFSDEELEHIARRGRNGAAPAQKGAGKPGGVRELH